MCNSYCLFLICSGVVNNYVEDLCVANAFCGEDVIMSVLEKDAEFSALISTEIIIL